MTKGALVRRVFALLVLLLASGCIPLTPIRRAALVPRPTIPANHGAPLPAGAIKGAVQVNSIRLSPAPSLTSIEDLLGQIPQEGAAGLWVPKLQVGAMGWGAPTEYLSVGAQFAYTQLSWAEANVLGVPDFPDDESSHRMYMGGLGIRGNIPLEGIVTPAIIGELNIASVPQAVYVCNRTPCASFTVDDPTLPSYELERLERKSMFLPTLAAHLTVTPMEYFSIVGTAGVQRAVKNIGFDPDIENLDEDTLTGYWHGIAAGGLEGRYEVVFATAMVGGAIGGIPEVKPGLQGTFSLGMLLQ